jgi:hypothetical protein
MRRLAPILTLAAALTITSQASAKGVLSVQVCGPDRCITSKDEQVREVLTIGGTPAKPPGGKASSYALRATVGDPRTGEEFGTFRAAWVPRFRMLVAEDGSWMRVAPKPARAFERMTSGLATFRPSQLSRLAPLAMDLPTATPPAPPRPAPAAPREPDGGGLWWLLVPAGIVVALGATLVRDRRLGATA